MSSPPIALLAALDHAVRTSLCAWQGVLMPDMQCTGTLAPVADARRPVSPVPELLVWDAHTRVQGVDGDPPPGASRVHAAKGVLLVQRQGLHAR